ncbi:hypothetical protein C0Q44_28200 [Paenibacillus sp. PCH8]|uniref:PIN-like domain-containing protein n=1 Tax=Paenibacillus sp. PCH8 TaxID=2066524 RepID=UPI000CF9B366|nr:PIN-like domain-containing protein [Paenibacillus sp. PCH8]PQP80298.1 hypothetical protein C0Q44_28200 [Paenibacillus sp. PCH8]
MRDNYENFKRMWDMNSLIVLDTNVLLRLYSLSPKAINQALTILNSSKSKIWLPAQVVKEFNDNHKKEQSRNFKKYDDFLKSIRNVIEKTRYSLEGDFIKYQEFDYPFLTEFKKRINDSIKEMQEAAGMYEKDIKNEIEINARTLHDDEINMFLVGIIESGATGKPFTLAKLISIIQEGEIRYKHLIPPGFEDIKKDHDDASKQRKYGDLILWKQTLIKAKAEAKALIFVTNDIKQDWWKFENKKPIEARPELTDEFRDEVEKDFIMISGANFISYVSEMNDIDDKQAYLELFSTEMCQDIFQNEDWKPLLLDKIDMYLSLGGDLDQYIGNALLYKVDIIGVDDELIEMLMVKGIHIDKEKAHIQGQFTIQVELTADTSIFTGYTVHSAKGMCTVDVTFSVEFELETYEKKEHYKKGTVDFDFAGFKVITYVEFD